MLLKREIIEPNNLYSCRISKSGEIEDVISRWSTDDFSSLDDLLANGEHGIGQQFEDFQDRRL